MPSHFSHEESNSSIFSIQDSRLDTAWEFFERKKTDGLTDSKQLNSKQFILNALLSFKFILSEYLSTPHYNWQPDKCTAFP